MIAQNWYYIKLKKTPQKVVYLWQLEVFFSAAPPAQNSAELHFRFIISFIQLSRAESLVPLHKKGKLRAYCSINT